jgi:hypothetical protein
MTMVDTPMNREPVEIDARRMTPARRARIIARDGGCCTYPECEVTTGLEVDHTIALELGGKDHDDNLRALCGPHHKAKTKLDVKLIAKAKRRKSKAAGTWHADRPKMQGRGFARDNRKVRTVSGQVRERD